MKFVAVVLIILLAQINPALAADLNEHCTVSVLNRNVQVKPDGTWVLPNIPANFGRVRARATCVENGQTRSGESSFFTIPANGSIDVPPIPLGQTTEIPTTLTVTSNRALLSTPGAKAQLTVTGTFSSSNPRALTAATTGTSYNISNPEIATVSSEGVVTAMKSGTVFIQAINEGTSGLISIKVSFSNGIDSDNDGIPDDEEILLGLNPNDPIDASLDLDADGLINLGEYGVGTNIRNRDTDGDGLLDGEEVRGTRGVSTNPLFPDTDGDGIKDLTEFNTGSNPTDSASYT
jgi:hypothetical protein